MSDTSKITAYRPCVGIMLLNKQRQVWIGRRFEKQNDEGIGKWWQMPQGGIDKGEDASLAALRELQEETGVTSAQWFALEFTGEDSEINLAPSGHKQEFDAWRWVQMDEMLDLIIPFKREVYIDVIAAFRHFGA
jgi:putative (di)nucleoside polyphosphate hydrolase